MPATVSLVTLEEMRTALATPVGDVDPTKDAQLTQSIQFASAAVATYTDRNFAAATVTEQRTFEYDGSGFVEVDDCSAITAVTYSVAGYDTLIGVDQWRAEPYESPIKTYLELPSYGPAFSPAMGFKQNLDVIFRERGGFIGFGPLVKVDATWGWTYIPPDVKQAVIWTAVEFYTNPAGYRSQSIAGYSYQQDGPGQPQSGALPERAKDLLAPYLRLKVG